LTACLKIKKTNVTLNRDCTGTYISSNSEDYLISNDEITDQIESGTNVTVTYKKIEDWEKGLDGTCFLDHEYKGIIEVLKIK
jgi:hypothetical protein